MVSKANEDLPEPLSPVITVRVLRGIATSMFLRLCWRAPRTVILVIAMPERERCPSVMWTGSQNRWKVELRNSTPYLICKQPAASTRIQWKSGRHTDYPAGSAKTETESAASESPHEQIGPNLNAWV